jgi:hypothetical protein
MGDAQHPAGTASSHDNYALISSLGGLVDPRDRAVWKDFLRDRTFYPCREPMQDILILQLQRALVQGALSWFVHYPSCVGVAGGYRCPLDPLLWKG